MGTLDQYYKILGVRPGASLQEINQAYISLLNRLHSSRSSGDPRQRQTAQEMARKLNEAYGGIKKSVFSPKGIPSSGGHAWLEPPSGMVRHSAPANRNAASPLKSVRQEGNLFLVALSVFAAIIALEILLPSHPARQDTPLPARLPIVRQQDTAPKLPALPAPPSPSAKRSSAVAPAARSNAPPRHSAKPPPAPSSLDRRAEEDAASHAAAVKQSAEQGDRVAQGWLAYLYVIGKGVPQNYGDAAAWFRRAAVQENAEAQDWLGYLYETGKGVTQDYIQSAIWYRRAAEQGDAEAQKNLALLYANGTGVAKNLREAIKWYGKAAAQGNFEAQRALEIWREP